MIQTHLVIPTYNEKENITKLLPKIFSLPLEGLHVLIVDDRSPDGTGEAAEQLRTTYPNLTVIHRPQKAGLGTAYVAGFKAALACGAEFIFEMDADFSHDPAYIPQLLEAANHADLVIGSRYVPGGGVSNWNWPRRLISRFGNGYARIVLGLPYRDLTGGFKCYRRAVLEKIDLDRLSSVGYNFQIETTYKAHRLGVRVIEVPIVFVERAEGTSKFDFKIMIESFWKVILLKFKA
ncbi:MAG: dolichyl-phosphate beta-D-mannosyltransferase [Candidatus Buchananbacteria bacterium RIFCSPHIGHO2_02_FULL_56_16]|uniref:Dolichyl-phosphate beta-D-mannosyltransferase n=1 Tax=Candidatus Buchananbacteria bacterium RIFCSPHIGHO2_02_FULL_56_16 TaxID=1797542 RepID=A0A1G1YJS9_9BACT|nr:MAG: dolichyl-phosphate beta-D-mannosyltransferase [Candidatus Buchananbacteria bacterium RIFCSPHIGHO2_02_FULL_56_16]